VVAGSNFANEMMLKAGHFYAYYKPSALNTDIGVMSLEVNAPLLQVFESFCREEFTLKEEKAKNLLNGDKLININTENMNNFNKFFSKSNSVGFLANPNHMELKRKLANPDEDQKPILVMHINEKVFAPVFQQMLKPVVQQYAEAFDIFVIDDEKASKQFMDIDQTPFPFPKMLIIDPKNRQPLRHLKDQMEVEAAFSESKTKMDPEKSHMFKTSNYYLMPDQKLASNVSKWIEKFLDDEHSHDPMSLKRPNQPSLVKQLNSEQFTKQFV
jgi:hypothetical protein